MQRQTAMDQFRGFAIMTMVLANYLAGIRRVPTWLKYAPDIGLTVVERAGPAPKQKYWIFSL